MSDKISIHEEDLIPIEKGAVHEGTEKIILCELDKPEEPKLPPLPTWCYWLALIPFVGVIAIIVGCLQRRYRFQYQLPTAMVCVLSTSLLLFFVLNTPQSLEMPASNWKSALAEKAQTGVVFIFAEDSRWLGLLNHSALGTGVVIAKKDNTALVLTNRHVVCNSRGNLAKEVNVVTANNNTLPTEVVALASDNEIDMALLAVGQANGLEPLGNIAKISAIKTGEEVVAIGHPDGLSFTMTNGIISAIRGDRLIQHSAPINPGNSGGPLLNSKGDLIGINTFTIRDTQGLCFALSADFVFRKDAWIYYQEITPLLDKIK